MRRAFKIGGWLLYPGAAVLVLRLLWEETFLTWERGPQMVGFSLAHTGGPLLIVGLLSLLLLCLWVPVALAMLAWTAAHKRRPIAADVRQFVLLAATLGLLTIPYGFWQWVGVKAYGPGPHAGSYLVGAAAEGNLRLINTLLEMKVPVDTREPSGSTALSGAAVEGQLKVVRLLLDSGADVNLASGILNRTALMNAAETGQLDVARYLVSRGADKMLRDAEGKSAEEIALGNQHPEIAAILAGGKAP